ncbi:hypothetical protein J433_15067 [Corynebacterium glutamicum MT]|uniref:Transposase n=2 Tax=Corynebacterium glutamicum TaxID=1718 RepID=Q5KRB9_CORGT|nr:hypothetical protein C624_11860 [Corynebacterium glutamicum SCgG1]AGN22966.1 hypothetical protein C629_11870 [Corynebacterium glutamicum SCgG2]EGV40230.1 hypothetical protein CgS9114_08596 [Corynebacterium glutamicum S9114]EOA63453.1 hypothetical protein J433_15067 [Corynebacterium glutamicum MT]EPP40044.1 hypothetical protein A583_11398 [Corynebacterium glutamicum Z188]NII86548.1 putative radical SAM superfamily protein [Corynebacterium glutamicum]BAF55327.1 hypothetical protein cgR_2322 
MTTGNTHDVTIGLDVGKTAHHACGMLNTGKIITKPLILDMLIHYSGPTKLKMGLPASGGHIVKLLVGFLQIEQDEHDPVQTEQEG